MRTLDLHNFKSFLQANLSFSLLTVFAGMNSSGKSSLLESIRIHHDATKGLQSPRLLPSLKSNLSIDTYFSITIDGHSFKMQVKDGKVELECPKVVPFSYVYVSANRLGPRDVYMLGYALPTIDIGPDGSGVYAFLEKNAQLHVAKNLVRAPGRVDLLKPNVEAWLQMVSPGVTLREELDLKQDEIHPYFNDVRPTETGCGLSFSLPVIVALLAPCDTSNVVMIENPEAHLHPRGQVEMGKLISLASASGKQVFVETHSEHIVDGIRLCVKNGLLSNKDVTMYSVVRNDYETPSTVEAIHVAEDGKLDKWPEGFFDQSLINKRDLL